MPKHWPSFTNALLWIAHNESLQPGLSGQAELDEFAARNSTKLLAYMWNRTPIDIATKVARIRFAFPLQGSTQAQAVANEVHRPVTARKRGTPNKRKPI